MKMNLKRFQQRLIALMLCVLCMMSSLSAVKSSKKTTSESQAETVSLSNANAGAISPTAKASILFEVSTGRVLFAKNENQRLPMASTTKIMTALLVVEHGNLEQVLQVPNQASGVEGSSMYLEKGEKISVENLLYGLMLWSGNDAAVALAMHVGGTIDGFVELMNAKAKEIGANNTHFMNPNGLPNDQHYTTAYDLGLIATYAMRNPEFKKVVSTKNRTIEWEGHQYDRALKNKNKILFQYSGGNGVKTGYTKVAGKCLVASAERDDVELLSVVLNCSQMFPESEKILDYGFSEVVKTNLIHKDEQIDTVTVKNGVIDRLEVSAKDDIMVPMRKGEANSVRRNVQYDGTLQAPIKAGQTIGKIECYFDNILLGSTELYAKNDIPEATFNYFFEKAYKGWLHGLLAS